MSDLNRLQDETHDESHPALTPATDSAAPAPTIEPGSDLTIESEPDSAAGGAPDANGEAPRKKRRRGSRGGQRRKKPAGGGGAGASGACGDGAAPDDDDLEEAEAMEGSEDWTAASADRGLTDDDIGEQAREDAGLVRPAPAARPKIGDSRPA